ncbi:hypothetical protein [Lactococcus lactis]|uniref:hypothetical protein n=1 Tax=Lactococcus lactis TaxID=1358 RepID=UPI0019128525|nr:hypothetical protein [Lactococcus lactis]WDA67557.1 hypothetical protein IL310_01865 [Lactococcus lactis]
MFESTFTKWEWAKISWIIISRYFWAGYKMPKKILFPLFIFIILGSILNIIADLNTIPLLALFTFSIVLMLAFIGYSYSLIYSKKLIFFYSTPSSKKQDFYRKMTPLQKSRAYGPTYEFKQHTILSKEKQYTLLLETKAYFLLFYKSKTLKNGKKLKRAGHQFLVIKKTENQELLEGNSKSLITLLEPYCKNYKKINH